MDLYREDRMPPLPVQRYRYPVAPAAVGCTLFCLSALGCLWIGWHGGVTFHRGGVPGFIGWWAGAWLGVMALLGLRGLRARLRASNWLAAVNADGLTLKFRSYLNYHFPPDELAVVFVPWREIVWVRGARRVETVPGTERGASTVQRRWVIELQLSTSQPRLTALAAALDRHSGRRRGTRYNHFPVRLTSEGGLEILWEAQPDARRFLEDVAPHTKVLETENVEVDYTRLAGLPAQRQREHLARLAARGDTGAVIKLAKQLYGFNTVRAMAFADELRASASGPAR